MKVCFLAETYVPYKGGSETFLKDLIDEMKKKHEIILITRDHPEADGVEKSDNLLIIRVPNFPLPRVHKYIFMSIVSYEIGKKVVSDCDIINVQNIAPCFAGHVLKESFNIPYVQTIEAIPVHFASVARSIYKLYLKLCNFDRLVVWTESIKETLEKWGFDVTVIEGGVNTHKFSPKVSDDGIASNLKKPVIVTVKPLYKNNAIGISYLIRAMKYVDGTLLIVGGGAYRDWLERLVSKLNLESKVVFAGHVSHDTVPKYYAASDVIVNSIIFDVGERPSVSLLESMAMGKPVILTKNKEEGDINNNNVCLARIGDPKDIANKIKLVLNDKNYSRKIGRNGRKLVEKKYSMKVVCRKLIKVYESLI